jgi:DNA-binding winged helix-turn-helix (wHTH) protein/tetratricopeptide (TPR) repeat protein
MSQQARQIYEFGPFRLDPTERVLSRAGRPVNLTPKAFDVLLLLIRSSGRLVQKSEFMTLAWADSFVEESNLTVTISMLRKILEGEAHDHRYIETVSKRGYRFVAQVAQIIKATKINSLAILPFRYSTPDASHSYLKVGLVDAIISRLAGTGQMVVRPTSAVLRYENRTIDPMVVGREQKVDAVVTGNIEISSGRIRVSVQLIRAEDGDLIFAMTYERDLREIFALEDAVAEGVAQSTVSASAREKSEDVILPRRNTENSRAYRLYLEGRYFWNKRTADGLRRGIECFQRAIDEDASYTLAYSGLADSYVLLASHGAQSPFESSPVAKKAALQALKLDSSLAEAHTSLGMVYHYYDWNWEEAELEFQKAIGLNPNYIVARMWYASNLASLGRLQEALFQAAHAEELDPLSLAVYIKRGRLHYWMRDYEGAISAYSRVIGLDSQHARAHTRLGMVYAATAEFDKAITEFKRAKELSGADPYLDGFLGYAHARLGKRTTARKAVEQLADRSQREYIPAFCTALIYVGLEDTVQALRWLEKAYEDRSAYMVFVKVEPLLDQIRQEPRFQKLLNRMRLG